MQAKAAVKNACACEYGTDMFVKLEKSDVSKMKDIDRWFLQLHAFVTDPKQGNSSQMVGFANPMLVGLLNGDVNLT